MGHSSSGLSLLLPINICLWRMKLSQQLIKTYMYMIWQFVFVFFKKKVKEQSCWWDIFPNGYAKITLTPFEISYSFDLPVGTCQPVHLHGLNNRYGPLAAMSLTLPVFSPGLWRSLSFALSNQVTSSMTCRDFYKIITFQFTN